MSNWAGELARWAPSLTVVQYTGSAEARADVYFKQVCACAGWAASVAGASLCVQVFAWRRHSRVRASFPLLPRMHWAHVTLRRCTGGPSTCC
jgi:hypothetical protein